MKIAGVPHYAAFDATAALLARIASLLETEGVPYSLAYGTALGAVRHGGFIPHDNDVDLFVSVRHAGIVRRLAQALGATTLYTDSPWGDATLHQKLRFPGCFDIDFFTEDIVDDPRHRAALAPFFRAERPELASITFSGRAFSIIPNYRQHLDLEYGSDWADQVHLPGRVVPLDEYLREWPDYRQPDLRLLPPRHCVVNGVFDLLHAGHVNLLARAWLLFGTVTAAVDSDALVSIYKREPVIPDAERMKMVGSLRWVQNVVSTRSFEFSPASHSLYGGNAASVDRFFETYKLDCLLCGIDDVDPTYVDTWFAHLRDTGRLATTDRTPGISTSQLIKGLFPLLTLPG